MVKMYAPKGVDQVSVEGQNFKVDRDGYVTVPDHFQTALKHAGFKLGPTVIEVTDATAAAIKSTANAVAKTAKNGAAADQGGAGKVTDATAAAPAAKEAEAATAGK